VGILLARGGSREENNFVVVEWKINNLPRNLKFSARASATSGIGSAEVGRGLGK